MKKTILISSGILIALLIAGVWGYLFLFGPPEGTENIFANFGIGGESTFSEEQTGSDPRIDTSGAGEEDGLQRLRQLTTKPAAGAAFVTDDTVHYAERGTGYLYRIDLASGAESQLSGTTHTKVIDAEFSPSGNTVILTIETASGLQASIETLVKNDTGETALATLITAPNVYNATFSSDGTRILYTSPTSAGSAMYAYNLDSGADTTLLNIPFRQVSVSWGTETYVYPRPTEELMGHVYRMGNGSLQYLRTGGLGLTAFGYDSGFVVTEVNDDGVVTNAFEDAVYSLPLPLFPEKCTGGGEASMLICAAPLSLPSSMTYPDDWYKGVATIEDYLWEIDTRAGEAALIADPLTDVGRAIDVLKITPNADRTQFLLINKNDNTLWLFEPEPARATSTGTTTESATSTSP